MGSGGAREIKREGDEAVAAPIPDFKPLAGGLKVIYFVLAGLLAFTYAFPLALDPSLHLLLLATTTIACGCFHNSYLYYAGLKWNEDHASDAELYLKSEDAESISEEDAWKFPLMGSCVLLGLFLVCFFVRASNILAKSKRVDHLPRTLPLTGLQVRPVRVDQEVPYPSLRFVHLPLCAVW